jgi:hypothetical protein
MLCNLLGGSVAKVTLELTMQDNEFEDWQDATNGPHFFELTVLNSHHTKAVIIHYVTTTQEEYSAAPE